MESFKNILYKNFSKGEWVFKEEDEEVLEENGADGCTVVWIQCQRNVHLEMVKMIHFVLGIFHQNKITCKKMKNTG